MIRRGLYQINTGEILLPKGLSVIGLGQSVQGSREGTRDFDLAASACGCKTVFRFQGSVTGITVKLNKSHYSFLFVCTLENYLYNIFLDPNAVWTFNANLCLCIKSISISKLCIKGIFCIIYLYKTGF